MGLEGDDDVCDPEVSLLLQVSQDASPEEDLALANPVQVGIQFQGFDLLEEGEVQYAVGPQEDLMGSPTFFPTGQVLLDQ